MPNFNGTGPEGKGPMTGGGMGYCILPIDDTEREIAYLKNMARVLRKQLKQIKARVAELEKIETMS